uniref:Uncharacterized protein n=1 Tax=Biomphalaria glabrata TaxID=6526 RepID=A0A2C9LPP9_BIOGL
MYYRKGTDQHLTFLRNMREAHAMYPFTGKRDKELFDKALAELIERIPVISHDMARASEILYANSKSRIIYWRAKRKISGRFVRHGDRNTKPAHTFF